MLIAGLIVLLVAVGTGRARADSPSSPEDGAGLRKPQWPLKTGRTLVTDEQVSRARALCAQNPQAARLRASIGQAAEYWVSKSDEELRALLPNGEVPRAFDVSPAGCPVHGQSVFRFGTYPWKLDRARPFVVICPVGGEEYPSNDFGAFLRSGGKDRSLLTGPYADDGRGWLGPDGRKFWFVAYACHWNWRNHWLPAVTALSQAYALTGQGRYAAKAAVMLDRIAEVYPGMDYSRQSQMGEATGGKHPGKIVDHIWEAFALRDLAVAYDLIFDALTGPKAVMVGKRSAAEVRANVEANLLEEGLDSVASGKILGNWGMHQRAALAAALVRGGPAVEQVIGAVLRAPDSAGMLKAPGVEYAVYNLVWPDGLPSETAPGYCFGWAANLSAIAEALQPGGVSLYANPKIRRMYTAPLEMICLGRFTPAVGDAGNLEAGLILPEGRETYARLWRRTGEPIFGWALAQVDAEAGRTDTYRIFEDLLDPPVSAEARAAAGAYRPRPRSRLLPGYGLAVLNNLRDSVAVSMYYGQRGNHGHFDRLNIELFACGRRLAPDLGYPDFMNAFVPGIHSWTKNTLAHNTVMVDRQRQAGNATGRVLRFHEGHRVRVVDVNAPTTYTQTRTYRRTLLQVDVSSDDTYLVDVFRVSGGRMHDLSVHGPPGAFRWSGAELSAAQKRGTLAGEEVPVGQLYDDAVRGRPEYKGEFSGYTGSGYQHLYNVQRTQPGGAGLAEWRLAGPAGGGLRVHFPADADRELVVADARVSPVGKTDTVLKYVLARRQGGDLSSCFVTVWEPVRDTAVIKQVRHLGGAAESGGAEDPAGRTVPLVIELADGRRHLVVVAGQGGESVRVEGMETDAALAVLEQKDKSARILGAAGGSYCRFAGAAAPLPPTLRGRVTGVDYAQRVVQAHFEGEVTEGQIQTGRWMNIRNDRRSAVRGIDQVALRDGGVQLRTEAVDLLCGRMCVAESGPRGREIPVRTPPPWGAYTLGTTVLAEDMTPLGRLEAVRGQTLVLAGDLPTGKLPDTDGDGRVDVYLAEIGVGDEVEIEGFYEAAGG